MKQHACANFALFCISLFIITGCVATSKKPKAFNNPAPQKMVKPQFLKPIKQVARKAPLPKPPKPIYAPNQLSGLNDHDVSVLLGPPAFKRHDAPAEIWQYSGDECLLDVFLYGKDNNQTLVVAHSEARNRNGAKIEQRTCMISLIKER